MMKIEWQVEDIQAGRIVGKPDRGERWMIGWLNGTTQHEPRWCLVSLSDGCIQPAHDATAMAASLNQSGEVPAEFFSDPSHFHTRG
jgi:hypothetical protein